MHRWGSSINGIENSSPVLFAICTQPSSGSFESISIAMYGTWLSISIGSLSFSIMRDSSSELWELFSKLIDLLISSATVWAGSALASTMLLRRFSSMSEISILIPVSLHLLQWKWKIPRSTLTS